MAINKRHCLPCERIGQIFRFSQIRHVSFDPSIEIGRRATEKTEEFVETALHRMEVWSEPQVPFADRAADVTCGL